MNTEFETKVLDIDVPLLIRKLRSIGAKEFPETLMRRYVFDNNPENMEFIRLREYQGKATLAYKYKIKNNTRIGDTAELEVGVSDFDKTAQILLKIPFKRMFYQENKRHIFTFKDVEYSIDTWPMLHPFLEIEAKNNEELLKGLKLLDLEGKDIGDKDIKIIYRENGINLHSFRELRFNPI